ncbi:MULTISPECIES: glycosyltransferase family 2 protein [unclassified Aureimonas]|uniref:glycosyltransferase family 2 protein n=1 Tax=unclassified Aureimonas TaxID=2615206 RepID=UPI0006FC1B6C|nr:MULTISPECIES: glycosyltransferase [unclassified Aureimonas]KQT60479.1 hypothetical protein ASG62_07470 [Aureimonas sp. Leaf427]KQT79356.1 hypothetical protein ASG54_10070 [Aureimonas sp. Leaf460]
MTAHSRITPDLAGSAIRKRVVIGIASAGRPAILAETVRHIATTLHPPADEILVCTPTAEDALHLPELAHLRVVVGQRGLCVQRNALLDAAETADLIIFFDDDFFPAADFVERTLTLFDRRPDVAIATGNVVLDGIHGAGVSFGEARETLARTPAQAHSVADTYNAYGCNMVVRMDLVREHGLRFDERLPLYGWLEDLDFSRRIAAYGRSVRCTDMVGVHLGVKSGRQPGLRLGYSQIANPWYMLGKRTMSGSRVTLQIARHLLANAAGVLRRDATIDRWGRLKGNLRAIGDILLRRCSPERILSFDAQRKPAS